MHRGVRLSQRLLPRTQALQLFWREAAEPPSALMRSILRRPEPMLLSELLSAPPVKESMGKEAGVMPLLVLMLVLKTMLMLMLMLVLVPAYQAKCS